MAMVGVAVQGKAAGGEDAGSCSDFSPPLAGLCIYSTTGLVYFRTVPQQLRCVESCFEETC